MIINRRNFLKAGLGLAGLLFLKPKHCFGKNILNPEKKPAIINIINAESNTSYSKKLLPEIVEEFKDLPLSVSVIPFSNGKNLNESDSLVRFLRAAYDKNPEKIEIGLHGYRFNEHDFLDTTYKQMRNASNSQSIFTQAFNFMKQPSIQKIMMASTMNVPFYSYNSDTVKAIRPAGIKIIMSDPRPNRNLLNLNEKLISEGYRENKNGVTEIFLDSETNIVKSWNPLKIRSIGSFKKNLEFVVKNESTKNPVVITIPIASLWERFGFGDSLSYVKDLAEALRENKELDFILPRDFYLNNHKGPARYVIARVDDERVDRNLDSHHRAVINLINSLGVSVTDGVIPFGYGEEFKFPLLQDQTTIDFLNQKIKQSSLESAIHGLTHSYNEFEKLSLNKNVEFLSRALKEFSKVDQRIEAFIPPYNIFNENTLKGMYEVGLKVISADHRDKMFSGVDKFGIFHASNVFNFERSWNEPFDYYSFDEILSQFGEIDDVTLMIHPQTINNLDKLNLIRNFLTHFNEDKNAAVVNLNEFYSKVMPNVSTMSSIQNERVGIYTRIPSFKQELDEFYNDAENAWKFFTKTVEPTGLNPGNIQQDGEKTYTYPKLTMWDFGSLIMGNVSARGLELQSDNEFRKRISGALSFLSSCKLTSQGLPNKFYNIFNNTPSFEEGSGFDSVDFGRLLSSLKILGVHYPEYKMRTRHIIKRMNVKSIIKKGKLYGFSNKRKINENDYLYSVYTREGYKNWGFKVKDLFRTRSIDDMDDVMAFFKEVKNKGGISSEPSVIQEIELGHTEHSKLIADLVYSEQKRRYNDKEILTCVSEGILDREPWFLFQEYVIGSPESWKFTSKLSNNYNEHKFISTKAAFAWDAIKNDDYSELLYRTVKEKTNSNVTGFYSGIYESGEINAVSDINTNAIILESIWYRTRGKHPLIKK